MHDTTPSAHSLNAKEAKKSQAEGKQIYYLSKSWSGAPTWGSPPVGGRWSICKTSSPMGSGPDYCYYDNYWLAHAEALKRNE